jgi:hypothetical protein
LGLNEYEEQYQAYKPYHYPRQFGDKVVEVVRLNDFDLFYRNLSIDINGITLAFASKEECIMNSA